MRSSKRVKSGLVAANQCNRHQFLSFTRVTPNDETSERNIQGMTEAVTRYLVKDMIPANTVKKGFVRLMNWTKARFHHGLFLNWLVKM